MEFIVDRLHSLRERYEAWRYAQFWTAERCLNYLRLQLVEDKQWLADNHIASTLCQRYLSITGPDWMSTLPASSLFLRKELGLETLYKTASSAPQAAAPDAWLYTVEYPLPDGSVKQMKFAAIESNLDFQSDIKCIDKQPLRV